jgi:glutamate formiminotransferase
VFTLAGEPNELVDALLNGARRALELIDMRTQAGAHPRVGAVDVAPVVYAADHLRGLAGATALLLADRLASEAKLPVFLYGTLSYHGHTRAGLRQGGPIALAERIERDELRPDFGPHRLHPTAGATLVAARPPLVAFNVELAAPASLTDAQRIAAQIREDGPAGLPGLRAIGVQLHNPDRAQVSTNVEDHLATPLAAVVEAIARHAEIKRAELVGLPPRAAFDGFPDGIEVANRRCLEDVLTD